MPKQNPNRFLLAATALLALASIAGPSRAASIDGVINDGEWSSASVFSIIGASSGPVGTAYITADTAYAYAALDVTGWTSSLTINSHGSLLGFGIQRGTGNYPAGSWLELQMAPASANWGGGPQSGTWASADILNGLATAFRINTEVQGALPAGLQTAGSFGSGHLVWELALPLATIGGLNPGDQLQVAGGINFSGRTHWYPGALVSPGPFNSSNYGVLTLPMAPVPLPASLPLFVAGVAAFGWIKRRKR